MFKTKSGNLAIRLDLVLSVQIYKNEFGSIRFIDTKLRHQDISLEDAKELIEKLSEK